MTNTERQRKSRETRKLAGQKRISFYLTDEQKADLDAYAAERGMDLPTTYPHRLANLVLLYG